VTQNHRFVKQMKKILASSILLVLGSCATTHSGTYYCVCSLYGQSEVVVHLHENGQFQYNFVYSDEDVRGSWKAVNDTLFLRSKIFTVVRESLTPKVKFNDRDTVDRFVARGNKLFPIVARRTLEKTCYLIKQKPNVAGPTGLPIMPSP